MRLTLKPGPLPSIINVPGSKSYANRLLILAAAKKESVTLTSMPHASDVTQLVAALRLLGLTITSQSDTLTVQNAFPACEISDQEIPVGEGGTTARFLATLLLLGKKKYTLILGDRLKDRPWQEFLDLAHTLGARAQLESNKLTIQGPCQLHALNELDVDCSRTTQFASGLQLALAFQSVKVVPKNLNASQSYWQMTENLISQMRHQNSFAIPKDWSSASYAMAFAAHNHEITFPGLHPDPDQADSKFYGILKSLHCVEEGPAGIKVKPMQTHRNQLLDVSDCLDLVPTLAYFLSHMEGTHVLKGIENLVHKESDRLHEVIKLLGQFDRKAEVKNQSLIIEGKKIKLTQSLDLQLPDDHRMVMVGALFLLHHRGGSLSPTEAVNKSYPGFFDIISKS